ncbi:MAG: hypothetical protein RL616_146 [Verrucomicrobiota bacterium]
MFRQPVLQQFHQRLLFLKRQSIRRIQNLCELCHGRNLADHRHLGNGVLWSEKSPCTDNAAMIGILAERKLRANVPLPPLDEEIKPGWALV